jgi:hypothetical protein
MRLSSWTSPRRDRREQLLFIDCTPRKTNNHFLFPFAANKRKCALSVFRLQKTKTEVTIFH